MAVSPTYLMVILLYLIDHSVPETCNEMINRRKSIDNSQIQSKDTYSWDLEATLVANKTHVVTFKCLRDYKQVGNPSVLCFNNGSWNSDIPQCLEQCFNLKNDTNIELTSTSRTVNSTVKLNCKLPKYKFEGDNELTCNHGGWRNIGGEKVEQRNRPKCVLIPPYIKWKLYLIIAGAVAGGIVVLIIVLAVCIWTRRKHGKDIDDEVRINPDILQNKFCVKVWSADRDKKKLIVAQDMTSLKYAVCLEFGMNGRLILEEDGTEVETDTSLDKCKDKTLLLLGRNEKWQMARSRMYRNTTDSYAFHVFGYDRGKSAMILCFSLENLYEQVFHMFGYYPECTCLESDGTVIETDKELMAFTGSRLMVLKPGSVWTTPQNGIKQTEHERFSPSCEKFMYNVCTEDMRKRKQVFAQNIVELHFAAAKALGLRPPVELTTVDGVLIPDEMILSQHNNDTFLVTEVRRSRKLNLRRETTLTSSVYSA